MSKALDDVIAERRRQVDVEGWSAEHDDRYSREELATAAACYAAPNAVWWGTHGLKILWWQRKGGYLIWPWNISWWKPKDRRRDLVRAAALAIAAIEQMDRASFSADKANG
jgi:hypothetical protein